MKKTDRQIFLKQSVKAWAIVVINPFANVQINRSKSDVIDNDLMQKLIKANDGQENILLNAADYVRKNLEMTYYYLEKFSVYILEL